MKNFKKILSATLAVIMLLGCFVFSVGADNAELPAEADVWDGSVDTSWYDVAKDISSAKSITISTAEQLAGLSELAKDISFEGWTIALDADIFFNVGDARNFEETAPANTWSPINTFKGTFDGRGHVISGLYFKDTTKDHVGLFGTLDGATVKNVSVVNSYFGGKWKIGAIAGEITGKSTVSNCYTDAIIYANTGDNDGYVGGVVGANTAANTVIEKCWFDGTVTVTSSNANKGTRVGGILGSNDTGANSATVSDCLVTGDITALTQVAGIVGVSNSTAGTRITNCLMLGTVATTRNNATLYAAQITVIWKNSAKAILTSVYGLDTFKFTFVSAFIGDATQMTSVVGNGAFESTNMSKVSKADIMGIKAKDTLKGFGFDGSDAVWQTVADNTPVLKALADEAAGNYVKSSADEVYNGKPEKYTVTLNTPAQLAGISMLVSTNEAEADNLFAGWNIKLVDDMYFNVGNADGYAKAAPARAWTPIVGFKGVLDGQGHAINGLYCDMGTDSGAALIGTLGGTVTNLSVINSYFSGNKNVASVAGVANLGAKISKVYTDAYLDSFVQQEGSFSGGIVGQTQSGGCSISECQFAGTLKVYGSNSWSQKAGGILGYTAETVTVRDCLVTGIVMADTQVGGVVGVVYNNANVLLTNCVFLGKIVTARNNAVTYVGSIVGTTWRSNLTVTMTNCYHEENYSAIYTAVTPNKGYATAYYAALKASGTDGVTINDECAAFSVNNAESTVTALGNAWLYSQNEFPMLKTVVERFADANIFATEVQTNEEENSFRLVAGIKGIELEDYASVSYRIEVITQDGTLRDNEQSTRVYSGLIVDETPKTAEDYAADYLYIRKVTGFDNKENVTVICTPMFTHKDGRVIYGTPDAFVFAFVD